MSLTTRGAGLSGASGWGELGVGVLAHSASDQAILSSVSTPIALPNERYDTHGFHDPTVNNSRLTIPAGMGGLYLIDLSVLFTATDGGKSYQFAVKLNGTTDLVWKITYCSSNASRYHAPGSAYRLAAGEYIELFVWGNSTFTALEAEQCTVEFSLYRLGD